MSTHSITRGTSQDNNAIVVVVVVVRFLWDASGCPVGDLFFRALVLATRGAIWTRSLGVLATIILLTVLPDIVEEFCTYLLHSFIHSFIHSFLRSFLCLVKINV